MTKDPLKRARDYDVRVGPDGQFTYRRENTTEYGRSHGGYRGYKRRLKLLLVIAIAASAMLGWWTHSKGMGQNMIAVAICTPLWLAFVGEIVLLCLYRRRHVRMEWLATIAIVLSIGLPFSWWFVFRSGLYG